MTKKDNNEVKVKIDEPVEPDKNTKKKKKADKPAKVKKSNKEAEYLEQLQRLQAEFQNYKRRIERDWKDIALVAKADMSLKFISIIDDLERVLSHHEDDKMIEKDGVKLIFQKCQKLLKDEGVNEIKAVGEVFDPKLHAAVMVEDVDEDKDDIILEDWQKGYVFGERLLRPSQVKVGRHQPEDGE